MQRKPLPIGIQTFSEIREGGYYYVDKTPLIAELVTAGKSIFLSRPRRFGKSLLIDTIAELFAGNKALFTGLYIEDKWDWETTYPVIRISFGGGVLESKAELFAKLEDTFSVYENKYGQLDNQNHINNIAIRFSHIIQKAKQQHGKNVIILVDEYDKPILDNLTRPDIATHMRETLRDLYSVIKDQDANVKFAMLTGVSKFSKVSLFSGLNNLNDITINKTFSAVCGYTQYDLENVFKPELAGIDLSKVKDWYNGYNWTGESVYNPFDILLFLQTQEYRPYWFETGTPTFLVDLLTKKQFPLPQLENLQTDLMLLSSFDVNAIAVEALLFQTGYLTISNIKTFDDFSFYELSYPNLEVQRSLNTCLLESWTQSATTPHRIQLTKAMMTNDFTALEQLFTSFYASIPYDWYRNNPIANYEGYYASVFYAYFASLGLDITLEDMTNQGRIDMTVKFNNCYYLFEFKVIEYLNNKNTENNAQIKATQQIKAIEQIKDRNYAQKYQADAKANNKPIYLIGVAFSKEQRQVVSFEVEEG